jgi:hypothetical protein
MGDEYPSDEADRLRDEVVRRMANTKPKRKGKSSPEKKKPDQSSGLSESQNGNHNCPSGSSSGLSPSFSAIIPR